jgi:hypothetical protein
MTKSFAHSLLVASVLIAGAAPVSFAKATIIAGQNIKTFAAACDRSKTCINWGGGVFTNGGTGGVICNDKKCVKLPNDAPTRTGSNDHRSNDPSGSTVNDGGSKGDVAAGAGGSPSSMGGDGGSSID